MIRQEDIPISRLTIMKRKTILILRVFAAVLLFISAYILTQRPKVWCDQEWAGIALTRGGYRSWTMRFCDGRTWFDGKLKPVVITTNGYREGYFWFPQFNHVDVRKIISDTQPY